MVRQIWAAFTVDRSCVRCSVNVAANEGQSNICGADRALDFVRASFFDRDNPCGEFACGSRLLVTHRESFQILSGRDRSVSRRRRQSMLRTKVCLAEHGICMRINHQHGLPDERWPSPSGRVVVSVRETFVRPLR
jgi:hypothetical protein